MTNILVGPNGKLCVGPGGVFVCGPLPPPPPVLAPLTGMVAWYDASDLASLQLDVDGYVDVWMDKSGNDYHATSTTTNRPRSGAVEVYGRNVLDFAADYMEAPAAVTPEGATPFTLYAVFAHDTINSAAVVGCGSTVINKCIRFQRSSEVSYGYSAYDGAGGNNINVTPAGYQQHTVVATLQHTGLTIRSAFMDMNKWRVYCAWNGLKNITSSTFKIGALENLTAKHDGHIAELIMYHEAHTDAQIEQMQQYLRDKWQTPASAAPTDYFAWFDASDATTITSDENNYVQEWRSKIGTSIATAVSDATRPMLVPAAAGDKNLMVFDGAGTSANGDYLNLLDFSQTGSWPFTFFIVCCPGGPLLQLGDYSGVGGAQGGMNVSTSSIDFWFVNAANSASIGGMLPPSGLEVFVARYDPASGRLSSYGECRMVKGGTAVMNLLTSTAYFGQRHGADGPTFRGYLAEIVAYRRALTNEEIDAKIAELRTKWRNVKALEPTTVIDENFAAYAVDTFPASFSLVTQGSGTVNQKIIDDGASNRVLRLQGNTSIIAQARHNTSILPTLPQRIGIEAEVCPQFGLVAGDVSLMSNAGNRTGTILFRGDSIRYATQSTYNSAFVLTTYTAGVWYKVKMLYDYPTNKILVYINDIFYTGYMTAGVPTYASLHSGNLDYCECWFKNLRVWTE